jgi:hypothetical protein
MRFVNAQRAVKSSWKNGFYFQMLPKGVKARKVNTFVRYWLLGIGYWLLVIGFTS